MRMMTEQFSQLVSSSREPGTFPSQLGVNSKGHTSSSSGNPNESLRKVNAVISHYSGREIDNQVKSPNEPCRYPHQFFEKSSYSSLPPVSQGMLLMVSPMILILTILLSYHLKKMSLKRKAPLSQLTLLLLRVIIPLFLLLKKSVCLCLLFPIGLRRKTKPILRR